MLYRFAEVELDGTRRELRVSGASVALQPQAFAVLEYLLQHRERVVSKTELLTTLWHGVHVGEASLQKAISLARTAIGDRGTLIRTHSKQGYRLSAQVTVEEARPAAASDSFVPRFARSGEVFIAYHTVAATRDCTEPASGRASVPRAEPQVDIVCVPGWVFPMRAYFELPALHQALQSLAQLGRVILFDKRGTGLSDRTQLLAPFEQRVDDLHAVLDAVGSQQAILVGFSEAGPLCLLYAALYPERTRGLVLAGSYARFAASADFPHGWPRDAIAGMRRYIQESWGAGDTLLMGFPSRAREPEVRAWAARAEQQGASPGAALQLLETISQVDVRPVLGTVSVPTAIVHASRDPVSSVFNARYLAERIPGARLLEVDGEDHFFAAERARHLQQGVAWVMQQPRAVEERFLTSVLALLTGPAPAELARLDGIAARYRGVRARRALTAASPGISHAWSFDGPQRAIRCALELAQLGLGQLGVHTGEVSARGGELSGVAVEVAQAVARQCSPGELLVTSVVRDLVPGSALCFVPRGQVTLPGGAQLDVFAGQSAV